MESGDGNSDNTVKNCGDLQNNSASSSAAGPSTGCGCSNGSNLPSTSSSSNNESPFTDISECVANRNIEESILVRVTPTTGGQFDVLVCKNESVENFKKRLSKKLKVPKERICLLHRDRQLREGTLEENQLVDGSRLTLLPSVETGLLAQRPEQSVMQALESLNDSQVNDFLSGKAPLNLTMRLGDHMMLIQLQLSTVTPKSSKKLNNNSSSTTSTTSTTTTTTTTTTSSPNENNSERVETNNSETPPNTLTPPPTPPSSTNTSPSTSSSSSTTTTSSTPSSTASTSSTDNCRCENTTSSSSNTTKEKPALDTRALAEASRNLTQTLKQLSSEVLTNRGSSHSNSATSGTPASSHVDVSQIRRPGGFSRHNNNASSSSSSSSSTPTTTRSQPATAAERAADRARRQGAIIESMHHHGKGVYSGTFSGTLNPALQDKFGRPKRDISTIIHILNDLLCATPQYRGVSSRAARAAAAAAAAEAAAEQEIVESDDSVKYSEENQATRGKLEQLRQFMEMRRQRRRARREARVAPYSAAQWAASRVSPESSPTPSPATPAEERPCEARASIAASATEETTTDMDTSENSAELCELNPEPVLA